MLDYFDITHFVKDKEGLVLFLEEKAPSKSKNGLPLIFRQPIFA
jgi:hypothetical protein